MSSLASAGPCNQQITVIEFDECEVVPRFGTYQLKRMETMLRAIAPSATLPILTQNDIAQLPFALPPLKEQTLITNYIDRETAAIDCMVEKVEEAISHLQEYRTALITAAVMGKIDVREAVSAGEPAALAAEG